MAEITMHIDSIDLIMGIFGAFDETMKVLEKALDVTVLSRETELKVTGSDPANVELAMQTIKAGRAGRKHWYPDRTVCSGTGKGWPAEPGSGNWQGCGVHHRQGQAD